jgi:hypothetical protein
MLLLGIFTADLIRPFAAFLLELETDFPYLIDMNYRPEMMC